MHIYALPPIFPAVDCLFQQNAIGIWVFHGFPMIEKHLDHGRLPRLKTPNGLALPGSAAGAVVSKSVASGFH